METIIPCYTVSTSEHPFYTAIQAAGNAHKQLGGDITKRTVRLLPAAGRPKLWCLTDATDAWVVPKRGKQLFWTQTGAHIAAIKFPHAKVTGLDYEFVDQSTT